MSANRAIASRVSRATSGIPPSWLSPGEISIWTALAKPSAISSCIFAAPLLGFPRQVPQTESGQRRRCDLLLDPKPTARSATLNNGSASSFPRSRRPAAARRTDEHCRLRVEPRQRVVLRTARPRSERLARITLLADEGLPKAAQRPRACSSTTILDQRFRRSPSPARMSVAGKERRASSRFSANFIP